MGRRACKHDFKAFGLPLGVYGSIIGSLGLGHCNLGTSVLLEFMGKKSCFAYLDIVYVNLNIV